MRCPLYKGLNSPMRVLIFGLEFVFSLPHKVLTIRSDHLDARVRSTFNKRLLALVSTPCLLAIATGRLVEVVDYLQLVLVEVRVVHDVEGIAY